MLEVGGEVADGGVALLQGGDQLADRGGAGRLGDQGARRGTRDCAGARGDAGGEAGLHRVRSYPLRAPACGGFCLGACLLSVGNFAAIQSTMPPSRAAAR